MDGKTNVKDIFIENLNLKEYMKGKFLFKIREIFWIRTNINGMKANFKQHQRNREEDFLCVACGLEEEVNSHLRLDKDLSSCDGLVMYFREVMERRMKAGEKSM